MTIQSKLDMYNEHDYGVTNVAKDTNDKRTTDALGTQYRVNFTFQDDKFNLRQGSLIITADSPDHAKLEAQKICADRFENRYRITGVKVW